MNCNESAPDRSAIEFREAADCHIESTPENADPRAARDKQSSLHPPATELTAIFPPLPSSPESPTASHHADRPQTTAAPPAPPAPHVEKSPGAPASGSPAYIQSNSDLY